MKGVDKSVKKPGTDKPVLEEAYLTGMQPSMSWSNLLLECSFLFAQEIDRGPAGEPARYGSGFHEILAGSLTNAFRKRDGRGPLKVKSPQEVALKWGMPDKHEEMREHAAAGHDYLLKWLSKNEFRIDFEPIRKKGVLFLESALALKPLESARTIAPHDENHRYRGLVTGEQPGTLDLSIVPSERDRKKLPVLVEDHKTGEEDFSRPLDKPQLLSLAAATMRMSGATEAVVAVLHARRRGMPKVYADKVKLSELKSYETRIATSLARIGDGSMRPGPHCDRCPAKTICPARDADLLNTAGEVLIGLTAAGGALSIDGLTANDVTLVKIPQGAGGLARDKRLGVLYDVVRKAEALAKRIRSELRDEIIASKGAILPETPQGEYLIVREYEKENLSKDGILKAYGKIAGERMLTKLREDGAITRSKVQQLWPEKERGR